MSKEQTQVFSLDEVQIEALDQGVPDCDAEQWIVWVYTGKKWKRLYDSQQPGTSAGPLQGTKLYLWFSSNTTETGRPHALLEMLDIHSLGYVSTNLSGIDALSGIPTVRSLFFKDSLRLKTIRLENIPTLEIISFEGCANLSQISTMKNMPSLRKLNLKGCDALTKLYLTKEMSALKALDLSICGNIEALDVSGALQLTELSCAGCSHLRSIKGLEQQPIKKLNFSGCEELNDISFVGSLQKLEEIDLTGCIYLLREDWQQLEGLPALCSVEGIPLPLSSRMLADKAVNRKDISLIRTRIQAWSSVALKVPKEPYLLGAVGQATAFICDSFVGQVIFRQLIECAIRVDIAGAEIVIQKACSLSHLERISKILEDCVCQERTPLPPRILVSLATHLHNGDAAWAQPLIRQLRDRTLLALMLPFINPDTEDAAEQENTTEEIAWDDFSLSGVWKGYYVQKQKRYLMDINLTFSNGRIYGGGIDPLSEYTIEGEYNLETKEFYWVKQYTGTRTHAVNYKGQWENNSVIGAWSIRKLSDRFVLQPGILVEETGQTDTEQDWYAQTARAVHTFLNHYRSPLMPEGYIVHEDTYDQLITLLAREQLALDETLRWVFCSLASTYTRSEHPDWKETYLEKLKNIAFAQSSSNHQEQLLSAICMGIAHESDKIRLLAQADQLLLEAAKISSDTSNLRFCIAKEYIGQGYFTEALHIADTISQATVRDTLLELLCMSLLQSKAPLSQRVAVEVASKIDQRKLRLDTLETAGCLDVIALDPVAYGRLVTLLAEAPKRLKNVCVAAVEHNPKLVGLPLGAHKPVAPAEALIRLAEQNRILELARNISADFHAQLKDAMEKE